MKKFFLLGLVGLMSLMSNVVQGQKELSLIGEDSKKVEADMMMNARYLGSLEGLDIWLTKSDEGVKGLANKRDWHVVKFGDELVPMERADLPPYLLYVGSVNSRKNLLGVVKAMELMPKDLQLPLVVVGGGGSYKQKVKQYIAEKGMESRVMWPDMMDADGLKRLYTNAEMLVYPSFYEGFGLPVVEAQLCGCPVVTSNVSSLPEAGGPFALQADPNSPEDICEKMTRLLTDTELRQKTIEGGRQYASKTFDPRKLARQLMGVYEKLKN
jgi:glycosyltransferase involved in cell wall biosynthesis